MDLVIPIGDNRGPPVLCFTVGVFRILPPSKSRIIRPNKWSDYPLKFELNMTSACMLKSRIFTHCVVGAVGGLLKLKEIKNDK